jgi:hypothetical protein
MFCIGNDNTPLDPLAPGDLLDATAYTAAIGE